MITQLKGEEGKKKSQKAKRAEYLLGRILRRFQLPFGHEHSIDLGSHGSGCIQGSRRGGGGGAPGASPAASDFPTWGRWRQEEKWSWSWLIPFAAAPTGRKRKILGPKAFLCVVPLVRSIPFRPSCSTSVTEFPI